MSGDHQIDRENCYICGRGNPDVLERHHIVPRRHGGSDESVNLVDLCPTCHRALETLYDERFYRVLGIGEQDEVVQYAAADIAERLEELELHVSTEILKWRNQIEDEYITDFDPTEIQEVVKEHTTEDDESEELESSDKEEREMMLGIIAECQAESSEEGAPIDHIINKAVDLGVDQGAVEQHLERLRNMAEIYTPYTDPDIYRVVE